MELAADCLISGSVTRTTAQLTPAPFFFARILQAITERALFSKKFIYMFQLY
jgi:hypothetical protein